MGACFEIRIKMKLISIFFFLSYGEFLNKRQSSEFLTNRSKCGDSCAKKKGKCHDFCEENIGCKPDNPCHQKGVCDCQCVLENSRCLCKDCKYDDRCKEYNDKNQAGC